MFSKGDPRINREGRPAGIPNEATKKMKQAFALLIEANLDNMTTWLEQVAAEDPKSAMDMVIKLSERFVPKLSQQQLTDADGGDLFKNIQFKFGDEPKDE
jgi:hypothetical protein